MNINGIYYKNIVIDYHGVYHLWAIPLRSKNVRYTQEENKINIDKNKVADLKATIEKCAIGLAAKLNSGEVIL